MDKYEKVAKAQMDKIQGSVFKEMFEVEYPPNTNNPVFECGLSLECSMPKNINTDIYLKVFKTGTERAGEPIIVHLQDNQYFDPDCFY